MKKTCKKCNITFNTNYQSKNYCSHTCYLNAQKPLRLKRNLLKKSRIAKKICLFCGINFLPRRSNMIFCSNKCVQSLRNSKMIKKTTLSLTRSNAKIMRQTPIPTIEKEILLGTLLGDSSSTLATTGYHDVKMNHCDKQLDYLKFKADIMPSIFTIKKPWKRIVNKGMIMGNKVSGYKISYGTSSISHPCITLVRNILYINNKKKITINLLENMTATSWLFWYIDDGSINFKKRSSRLATHCFSMKEVNLLKDFLFKKYNIESSSHFSTVKFNNKIFRYPILSFTVKGTLVFHQFLKTSPFFSQLPKCTLYKFRIMPYKQKNKLS